MAIIKPEAGSSDGTNIMNVFPLCKCGKTTLILELLIQDSNLKYIKLDEMENSMSDKSKSNKYISLF